MTKYLLYNSRLVRPEMEKPMFSALELVSPTVDTYAKINDYHAHLSTLPGIECSEELLAKWKDGDWLEEGKDFEVQTSTTPGTGCEQVIVTVLAVPVQSDEEDLWMEVIKEIELNEFRSTKYKEVLDKLKQSYKLTKR